MHAYLCMLACLSMYTLHLADSNCDLSNGYTVSPVVLNILFFFLPVLGNALDEDLGRLNLASLDTEQDADVDSNSLSSPLSSSLSGATSAGISLSWPLITQLVISAELFCCISMPAA